MPEPVKTMDLREFREAGYLQEVNRQFFHPLGLALAMTWNERDRVYKFAGVLDARDDPEGFTFDGFTEQELDNGYRIEHEQYIRRRKRPFMTAQLDASGVQRLL